MAMIISEQYTIEVTTLRALQLVRRSKNAASENKSSSHLTSHAAALAIDQKGPWPSGASSCCRSMPARYLLLQVATRACDVSQRWYRSSLACVNLMYQPRIHHNATRSTVVLRDVKAN